MKKIALSVLALIIALILFFALKPTPKPIQPSEKPIVKIGVIGPLTGDIATMGQNCRNAIELALDNIKDSPVTYQMIYEDDAYQPAKAAMAANKLTSVDKVSALITCSAISGSAAVSIAGKNKTFMIGVIASAREIAENNKYGFLHWTPAAQEAKQALKILQENNVKKLVIFELQHPGLKAINDGLTPALQAAGIDFKTFTFMPTERDFATLVDKANTEHADMWMLLSVSPTVDLIIKNMKDKGIMTPYTSIEVPSLVEDKSLFEGVSYVDTFDGMPEILDQYRAKYHTQNVYGVAFSYDAMMIINTLIAQFYTDQKRLPTADDLVNQMHALKNYTGAVGKIEVLENNMIDSNAVIKKIINKTPVLITQ